MCITKLFISEHKNIGEIQGLQVKSFNPGDGYDQCESEWFIRNVPDY